MLAFEMPVRETTGWFVGPAIFTNVSPDSRLAQEIFGPVLSIIDARDLDEALRIAMARPSRLPAAFSPAALVESTGEI
jgi:acyl-CoA reductase-like NAD-dependent aldehyde dehydrogenase